MQLFELIIVLFFLVLFSIFSYKKRLLDFEGVLIANAVGLAAITFGPNALYDFIAVVVFFVIGEIASNYPRKKHEQRDIWNVVGNSLPALLVLSLVIIYPENSFVLEMAFFGAISAALADTLSSEIGYYSKSSPILITTFEKVRKGVDGGITILGEFSALLGGICIAIFHLLVFSNPLAFVIIIFAGIVGSNVDSIIGALFERKKLLNNTHVNLICGFSGALTAFLLSLLL
jgi:uncharacterized protein (TIGR00297 family)